MQPADEDEIIYKTYTNWVIGARSHVMAYSRQPTYQTVVAVS